MLGAITSMLPLLAGLAGVAVWQWRAAATEKARAETALAAVSRANAGTSFAVSPDKREILRVTGLYGDQSTAALIDISTGGIIRQFSANGPITTSAFSPDGARIALGDMVHSIRVFDARTGALVTQLLGHTEAVRKVSFGPQGTVLASISNDDTCRVWSMPDGKMIFVHQFGKGLEAPVSVTFTLDGARVIVTDDYGDLYYLDAQTGQVSGAAIRG
jgi:WD40 repeat protein